MLDEGTRWHPPLQPEGSTRPFRRRCAMTRTTWRRSGVVDDADKFDAAFFGIPRNEAELMDPAAQAVPRTAWECLGTGRARAGEIAGRIGVFAGKLPARATTSVMFSRIRTARARRRPPGHAGQRRVRGHAHRAKLNLTGPADHAAACSTRGDRAGLRHPAGRTLRMALAGGALGDVSSGQRLPYQEGPCRAMATRAASARMPGARPSLRRRRGRAAGNACPMRWLMATRFTPSSRGVAVNNDGAVKTSFTAPSVEDRPPSSRKRFARRASTRAASRTSRTRHGDAAGRSGRWPTDAGVPPLHRGHQLHCSLGSVKEQHRPPDDRGRCDRCHQRPHSRWRTSAFRPMAHFTTPNPKIDFEHSPSW